jgi:two-component system OmpR family sensor kinase
MASLRSRLFVGLTLAIIAAGAIAGGITYKWAFDEAIELQDSVLSQIGAVARASNRPQIALTENSIEPETRVVIENLAADESPPLKGISDGFHVVTWQKEDWRFLVLTRPDNVRLAVGQPIVIRADIARASALRTILPLALLIPVLMLVVGLVIRRTLKPMSVMAQELDGSDARDLYILREQGMPSELRPFIASINRLLERNSAMLDQQRRFISDAAHELRSPITALSLQAQNLHNADLPAESRTRLATLREGARRIAHLLEQLLALARADIGSSVQTPSTNMDRCAKEVLADLLPAADERGIDLGFEIIDPVSVQGDPVLLNIMLRNLIDNAIRYTPRGGRIDIGLYRAGSSAIFQIADDGPGIPDAELVKVFEPFVRGTKPQNSGTGLGLSIVQRIVERLGGSIRLENIKADRKGLRATVSLPLLPG